MESETIGLKITISPEMSAVEHIAIPFLTMHDDGGYSKGATVESVLELGLTRLQELNTRFPCRENSIAITKIQESLMWLEARTKDRIERGVEGQLKN